MRTHYEQGSARYGLRPPLLPPLTALAGRWSDGVGRGSPMGRSAPPHRSRRRCILATEARGKVGRRQVAQARMRPRLVVVPPPALDHRLRIGPRTEPFQAQALVAELAVEALRGPILPGLAGIDQHGADALVHDPLQQRPRNELRPIVGTQGRAVRRARTRGAPAPRSRAPSGCDRAPIRSATLRRAG
jgi:hypothetical protein